jgi:hypothetical protein
MPTEIDVFRTTFRLAPEVCILAPGPNGKQFYGKIPADFQIIAVSKAVLIPDIADKPIWIMNHCTQDWFDTANAGFRGMRVFSADAMREARGKLDPACVCYYYQPPADELVVETVGRVDGSIHYGITVSGCALQFAYNFGARRILLCGVDMSGDDYWDGSRNVHVHHGEVWPAAQTMNALIRWLGEERGVRVETLSKTTLEVPVHQGVTPWAR